MQWMKSFRISVFLQSHRSCLQVQPRGVEASLRIGARAPSEQEWVSGCGAPHASTSGCQCEPLSCGRSRQGLCPRAASSPGLTHVSLLEHSDSCAVRTLQGPEQSVSDGSGGPQTHHGLQNCPDQLQQSPGGRGRGWAEPGNTPSTATGCRAGDPSLLPARVRPGCKRESGTKGGSRAQQHGAAPAAAAAVPAGKHFSPPLMHQLHRKSLSFWEAASV